ncbi:hypothetical protein MHK_002090, partial [Candidatus Magnetomorum sp. HK-1]
SKVNELNKDIDFIENRNHIPNLEAIQRQIKNFDIDAFCE